MNGKQARKRRKLAALSTVGSPKKSTRKVYQNFKRASNEFVDTLLLRL